MRYGIIAALEFEGQLFKEEMENVKEFTILNKPAYSGMIGKNEVVVMQCGMGKVSASIGAQVMFSEHHPDVVINTGCAGALDPRLQIGDVVISKSVIEWDLDLRKIGYPLGYIDALGCVEMKADENLINRVYSARLPKSNVLQGLIVSGDQFVSTQGQHEHILRNFPNALCAEMEGAAIGHVCLQNNIPFCIIRTISDTAKGDSGVQFATFARKASHNSAAWLVKMLRES